MEHGKFSARDLDKLYGRYGVSKQLMELALQRMAYQTSATVTKD